MSEFRQCPYDPLHQIAGKKFASHLVKCKRQHPDVKLVKCHFDTSHLVKEAELRDHMRTCSGRNDLLRYKITINKAVCDGEVKLPDPAEDLVYSTPEPGKQKITGGISLQDDSECWDDFAYKAYDPLENCKSKLKNGKPFIIPIANRFAGQMQDAAALREDQVKVLPEEPKELVAECSEKKQREARRYGRTDGGGSSSYRSDVKHEPSDYGSERAGYSSSSKQHKYRDRDLGASSSSSRHEVEGDTRHRIKTEEKSYRSRDRSRSDSTSSSDRKSHRYEGHSCRSSYDASHSRHRKDRYEADRNSSNRRDYDRHTDSDTSDWSYKSSKHKLQPYQRYN